MTAWGGVVPGKGLDKAASKYTDKKGDFAPGCRTPGVLEWNWQFVGETKFKLEIEHREF